VCGPNAAIAGSGHQASGSEEIPRARLNDRIGIRAQLSEIESACVRSALLRCIAALIGLSGGSR
jgi:hypothetical protein